MPQKVKNKITGQLHACLHVSLLSPMNPLFSTTPLLLPPSFLLPFPLLKHCSFLQVGLSLITGSDQKRYLNQSRVNPTELKNIY
jgi:hypothetical protein